MPISTDNAANSEYLDLLKASADRLENTIAAMRETLTLKLPEYAKRSLTQNIQEGEVLLSQLRETLTN